MDLKLDGQWEYHFISSTQLRLLFHVTCFLRNHLMIFSDIGGTTIKCHLYDDYDEYEDVDDVHRNGTITS